MENIQNSVQDYYGKQLQNSNDLQTNACCTAESIPDYVKTILSEIQDEVAAKYYGCGLVIPEQLDGLKVLDLGSGSGRDCFLMSKLVGEHGSVIGVDFTDEQLAVANNAIEYHREKFQYQKSNVEFRKGEIENLPLIGLEKNTIDLIISNCVINLCTNKQKVLSDCFSLLKEGGEMYFSDVYVNKRIPQHLVNDKTLYGECLSGALYWNDFVNMAKKAGFADPRVVKASAITIENKEIQNLLEGYEFYSVTYRLFKLAELEPDCEDYGQAVIYSGTIPHCKSTFVLDQGHKFEAGKIYPVCGNTYLMLQKTRFASSFNFLGDFERHFGIFPGCGNDNPFSYLHQQSSTVNTGSCC